MELGGSGCVQPPTQGPLPAMQPSFGYLLGQEDPETRLLALLRWVQGGDTSGVREGGSGQEAGQTWRNAGSLRSCSQGNCLQRCGSGLHAVLHCIRM